jgi:hypothetical protein
MFVQWVMLKEPVWNHFQSALNRGQSFQINYNSTFGKVFSVEVGLTERYIDISTLDHFQYCHVILM